MLPMNNNDLLNKLLGLSNLEVMRSEFSSDEQVILFVESSMPVASCPECGHISDQLHDLGEVQLIRDLPIAERRCYLSYQARRFKCEHCQKTFVERVNWKRPHVSYTERYEHYVYQKVRRETVSQAAQDEGLSEEAVQAIFEHRAKKRLRRAATHK